MRPPLLSVNVNKVALLRNARGRGTPDLRLAIDTCLAAGAHGITIHPRMDQRHVRFDDVPLVTRHLRETHPGVELNIECEDTPFLLDLVCAHRPAQCTLVPVRPGEVTSDHGWSLPDDVARLRPSVDRLHEVGIRVSIFVDPDPQALRHLAEAAVDRVEIYTGPYAWAWGTENQAMETERVWRTAAAARAAGVALNAGHDLDRFNLAGLKHLPGLLEVSIGHAQVCRALEVGMAQSVQELLSALGH